MIDCMGFSIVIELEIKFQDSWSILIEFSRNFLRLFNFNQKCLLLCLKEFQKYFSNSNRTRPIFFYCRLSRRKEKTFSSNILQSIDHVSGSGRFHHKRRKKSFPFSKNLLKGTFPLLSTTWNSIVATCHEINCIKSHVELHERLFEAHKKVSFLQILSLYFNRIFFPPFAHWKFDTRASKLCWHEMFVRYPEASTAWTVAANMIVISWNRPVSIS